MKQLPAVAFALSFGLASAAEVPLADFARHPRHYEVKISPLGDFLAATSVVKDHTVLSMIHLDDMKGFNLRTHDLGDVAGFWWINPRTVVYNIGDKWDDLEVPLLNGELYSINADGSGGRLIAGGRDLGGYQGIAEVLGKLPGKDDSLLVQGTPWLRCDDGPYPTARAMTAAGDMQILATAPICGASFIADNAGIVRFAYAVDVDQHLKVFYRADAQQKWDLVFDEGKDKSRVTPIRFVRDNSAVYFGCGGDKGFGGICRWDIATHKLETVWSGAESAPDNLLLTADEKDAFAIESMPGRSAVTLLTKSTADAQLLVELMQQFPGQHVSLGSPTRDARKRIVSVESDVNPGEFYLFDSDAKKLTFLLARRPWIKSEQMAPMEPVKFDARDKRELHGYLTRPPGKQDATKLPLVVYVHGGPYGVQDRWEFDPQVQVLASRGYAVLQVNFRGSGGYGEAFRNAGIREWGAAMQDDVTDATRWAIEKGIADPARICIFGASYGGYAALEGAVKEPDLYKCAIGYVGVYDLRMQYTRGDVPQTLFGKNYLKLVLGENKEELIERSPIEHLDRLKSKVMLIAGGADGRVPELQGKKMHAELGSRGIEHEWMYERTEAHGFYKEEHVVQLYQRLLAFLDRQIGSANAAR